MQPVAPRWSAALKACGFLPGPSNFIFASSQALSRCMAEKGVRPDAVHVNRGDGDGPINLRTEHLSDDR